MGCFVANSTTAKSLSINVYLKLKPENHIKILIKEFNQYLAEQGIFTTYQIAPYINHLPLHVTLYLTNYHSQQIPTIIRKTKELATQQKPILLSTSKFIPNRNGYVMLTVTHNKKICGLSKKTLNKLAYLRDLNAIIPTWAAHDPGRQALFHQYGSPTVLNYFNPHFSIFSAEHLKARQNIFLYEQLQKLIHQFTQAHPTQIHDTAYAIGVGVADAQGQIIKELAAFPMK